MEVDKLVITQACKDRFEPVVIAVKEAMKNENNSVLVAIDGMCASGKTTLGYYLQSLFDCNLFHMDDFFLQTEQRTRERLEEIGGNVDYERFKEEVIEPLIKMQNVFYRPYRCDIGKIQDGIEIKFKKLNIIEGSYSQHPYLGNIYQLKVFVSISKDLQIERIRKRNGEEMLQRFIHEWIPMENKYFENNLIHNSTIIIN